VSRPYRIALLNPNTSVISTELMLRSARRGLPPMVRVEGRTVPHGHAFISTPAALAEAAEGIVGPALAAVQGEGFDALIVAGFGDPGLMALRAQLDVPVTGLGEAAILEAAQGGRPYAIVTVTPELHSSLRAAAHTWAPAAPLVAIRYTSGPLGEVLHTPQSLEDALHAACRKAVDIDHAEAIVIGGGPLAQAAQALAARLRVPVIDPVAAAVCLACQRGGVCA
jgi:allantoin racemase